MNILLGYRLICVASGIFATAYAIYYLQKSHCPLYFKCVFYGILSLLFALIFYLAISTMPDWNHIFTLGIFGEMASLLFFATANIRYIPREYEELSRKLSIPGLMGIIITVAIYALAALMNHSIGFIITDILYAASVAFCVYTSIDIIINKYDSPFNNGVKNFNILCILYLLTGAVLQVAFSSDNVSFVLAALIMSGIAAVAFLVIGIISLRKGLEPWTL